MKSSRSTRASAII